MSTIILDATNQRANRVTNFNDDEILAVTPDLVEAIDEAQLTAEAREGVVRVRVGNQAGVIEITTSPRALRLKVRALKFILFIVHRLIGMPDLVKLFDEATTTGTIRVPQAPARSSVGGRMVATPLYFPPERIEMLQSSDFYDEVLNAIRQDLGDRGFHVSDHLVSPFDSYDGLLDSVVFNTGHTVCFYGWDSDPNNVEMRRLHEARAEDQWLAASELALNFECVAGDEAATVIVFWRKHTTVDGGVASYG